MRAALKRLVARVAAFFGGRALDRDFDQELASHLAMQIDENIARGMTPEQAHRAARIRFGGEQSIKQRHREARGLPALENVLRDVRLAFRLIVKERAFSAAVILVLALGIGINALGFTIVNAAFLRGLPFPEAGQIYMLSWLTRGGDTATVSHAEFEDWRSQVRTFSALAAFTSDPVNISDDRTWPEEVRGARLTANAFDVLQQPPLFGRAFAPGDDRRGADPVAIIGYNLWRDRYGSDPDVLGKLVRVNGNAATIVGVMPERMSFPDNNDIWVPLIPTDAEAGRGWGSRPLGVYGRLKTGVSPATARTELNHVTQQFVTAYPDAAKDLAGIEMETFTEHFVGGMARVMFLVVMGAVGFVLLIACANVANLLLSRASYREREIALRMALGATRARVVWQLLLESIVLGLIGGGLGTLLAIAGARMFDAAVQDPGKPYWIVFTVDYVVLAYVSAICVLTAIVAGLAPALQLSRRTNHDALKEGGRGSVGNRRVRWMSATMVVTELTLTVVLLTGAGLMIRSFIKLSGSDIGFDTSGLMAMRMQLPASKYATAEARQAFFERLEPRIVSIAGVESMALTTSVPPFNSREQILEIDGRLPEPDARPDYVATISISPSFFRVLDLTLLRGRSLQEGDGAPGNETAIVNEQFVRRYFADQDPIGQRIRFRERNVPAPSAWRTIVGVSPSVSHGPMVEVEMDPAVYMPYRQSSPSSVSLLLRSQLPPASVMDAVRREVTAIDADQPVFTLRTLEQMVSESRWPLRVFGTLFAVFAVIALVLSSVGLYAVMAYSVTQRTQEIGVRMAVGASRRQVSWLILKRGLLQLAVGLAIGLAGAAALSRVVQGILVEISPTDPITFAAITTLLTAVSIAACLLPARRATRVDPVEALRAD